MEATIDAMTAKVWTIAGVANRSLLDAGYSSAGVDEGWEGCGKGVNGSQHDANGDPVINSKFPDMAGLVKYGHANGLKMGWYENGCACGERTELVKNYEGDVRMLHSLGFDGVKLDDCGAQRNMTLYAELMQSTGKAYTIENCHWGKCSPSDSSSCPTADWCPFNWFRTSGDINPGAYSWLHNLQTTRSFQDPAAPLSQPGCWAYPDMLEVGRIGAGGYAWNRAHFGAWAVVSAPLILGLDLTKQALVEPIIDIITNHEALAVNQAWSGHPGGLVWEENGGAEGYPAARPCNLTNKALQQQGWSMEQLSTPGVVALNAPGGGCLTLQGPGYPGGFGGLVIAACNASDLSQQFKQDSGRFVSAASGRCVDIHSGGPIVWMFGCSSLPNDELSVRVANGTLEGAGRCIGVESRDPAGNTQTTRQAWAKPVNGSVAVLMINPDSVPHQFAVPLSVLPFAKMNDIVAVRDIWAHEQRAPLPVGTAYLNATVGPMDSAFFLMR